jgi:hypothetical protein
MSSNYSYITTVNAPGLLKPQLGVPALLDTDMRGGLRAIDGITGDRLSDIGGLMLQDGMLVYVRNTYTGTSNTIFTGGYYYKYSYTGSRATGMLPTGDSYWSPFTVDLSSYVTNTQTGSFLTSTSVSLLNITSGDLTGQLLSPTINKIQGYSVNLTAPPADGQTLQWDAGSSSWKAGAVPVGGNGGGGLTYYFDFLNTSGINPTGGLTSGTTTLSLLGRGYSVGSGSLTSSNLTPQNTDVLVASFITASGNPGVTNIPAGLWDFNIWANSDTDLATQTAIKMVVNIYNPSTSSYRYLSASDYLYLYDGTTTAQYLLNVTIPQTGIQANERFYLQLFGKKSVAASRTVTFYFDSYRPSHVHTTLPSVAGDGIVKVINGVYQTPATGIFDSDVDANANISQSKIQGLTASLNSLYPRNNPSGFITGVDLLNSGYLLFTNVDASTRRLDNYMESGIKYLVRDTAITANRLVLTLANFTPSFGFSAVSPSTYLNWDQAVNSFTVSVSNPSDYTTQYITGVYYFTGIGLTASGINNYVSANSTPTPNGGVSWTQIWSTGTVGKIYSNASTGSSNGGTATITAYFKDNNNASNASWYGSQSISWGDVSNGLTIYGLNGTFLESFASCQYSVYCNNLYNQSNRTHTLVSAGGALTNSGNSISDNSTYNFNFNTNLHKDNTSQTRTITLNTTFTRPKDIISNSSSTYTAPTIGPNSVSASFNYPSFWLLTNGGVTPTSSNIVNGTSFYTSNGVTQLGETKNFNSQVTNSYGTEKVFWFGVRSNNAQPTTFLMGADSSYTPAVSYTTASVNLQPTSPPAGYTAEGYTLYGISLQANSSNYIVIS